MKTRTIVVPFVGAAVLALAGFAAWAQVHEEKQVSLDEVPAAVKTTIMRETANGHIKEIEVETADGKSTYEVEFVRDGRTFEIAIAADGSLLSEDNEEKEEQTAEAEEQERKVGEGEVPPAALAALKKLASGAKFTEFSEEIEHGSKFYEGSWKAPTGDNVDALVTAGGDLVEIEQQVPAEQVPAAVLAAVRKQSGPDAALFCEKKTMILYELKFRKDGRRHEVLYAPDGRALEREAEEGDEDE